LSSWLRRGDNKTIEDDWGSSPRRTKGKDGNEKEWLALLIKEWNNPLVVLDGSVDESKEGQRDET
jgi:hypothetical protein